MLKHYFSGATLFEKIKKSAGPSGPALLQKSVIAYEANDYSSSSSPEVSAASS